MAPIDSPNGFLDLYPSMLSQVKAAIDMIWVLSRILRERESSRVRKKDFCYVICYTNIELGDRSIYKANDSITCCFLFSLGLKEKPSYQCP